MPAVRRNMIGQLIPNGIANALTFRLVTGSGAILAPLKVGTPVAAALVPRGGTPPYSYLFISGSLPSGVTQAAGFATNGKFTGTPTAAGTFTAIYKVTDSAGVPASVQQSITFQVDHVLQCQNPVPPIGEIARSYAYQFNVTGATGTLTFTIASGGYGGFSSITTSGLLSQTYNVAGSTAALTVVHVVDSGTGDAIDIPFNWILIDPISLRSAGIPTQVTIVAGHTFQFDLNNQYQNGQKPYKFAISSTSNFTGVATVSATGLLTITPDPGMAATLNSVVFFTLQDALGYTFGGFTQFNFGVVQANQSQQFQLAGVATGNPNPFTVNFTGGYAVVTQASTTITVNVPSPAGSYQPLDADLTAIAALSGTGYLKRTGTNTWALDAPLTNLGGSTTLTLPGAYLVTASGLTTTAPAAPVVGDIISFMFLVGVTSWTFNPNGNTLEGTLTNMTWDILLANGSLAPLHLMYTGITDGWKFF